MKRVLMSVMAFLYVLAGVYHFVHPETYYKIMPRWVPRPDVVNSVTGVFEILLGAMLLPVVTRNAAAWGLIILLLVVFPANIQMAIDYHHQNHPQLWLAILRLPVQALLIWWAYSYTTRYLRR